MYSKKDLCQGGEVAVAIGLFKSKNELLQIYSLFGLSVNLVTLFDEEQKG